MNVKKAFTCMLTLLLVFAFFGCDQVFNPGDSGDTGIAPPPIDGGTEPGTGENPNDTWTEITSLDGLEGTWEAKGRVTSQSTGAMEIHWAIIYPVDGVDSSDKPVNDGVLFKFLDAAGYDFCVEKNVFEDGTWAKEIFEATSGTYYTNHLQTELKIVLNFDKSEEIKTASEWLLYQKDTIYSGDFFVSYSEDFPYIETRTIIFHKTSESTNPGENPDSGTNPGTGTEPGTGEKPNDTWTKITSLDGLEGTWKYAYRDFGDTSNDNIYELINTTEFILFNETGDVSASYMTDHTQEVKELSLADNRPENEIWKEIQNIYKEIPSDFSYEFTQSEPYISKSFGTIPRAGEQGFETLLIGDGTNSCTYINESKTQLKMVSILESTIYVSETGSQRPIKDDAEWEQYKAQQAPFLPEGDMFVTYSKGETYLETVTIILHKQ